MQLTRLDLRRTAACRRDAVATGMEGLHYVLHAPQGDTYADLLFTMIERRGQAPAGHLHHLPGARPRRRHGRAVQDRGARRLRALPAAGDDRRRVLHGRADPGRSGRPGARRWTCRSRSCRWSCPSYQKKENWGAAETFYQLVRALAGPSCAAPGTRRARPGTRPRCNILGPTALGFRHRDDVTRDHRPARPPRHRRQRRRRRWARRRPISRGSARPTSTSCSIPEIASAAALWLETHLRPARRPRPSRSASARRATSSPRSRRSPASMPAPVLAPTTLAPALVLALGRLDLPHRQARLHLRRRHPRHRRGAHRRRRNWASTSSASAPTAANSPARSARPRSSTASRR